MVFQRQDRLVWFSWHLMKGPANVCNHAFGTLTSDSHRPTSVVSRQDPDSQRGRRGTPEKKRISGFSRKSGEGTVTYQVDWAVVVVEDESH